MTIQKTLISAVKKLRRKSLPAAHLEAEVLLSTVLNKPRGYLLANQKKEITPNQFKKFNSLMARRQKGTPIPYLTNHQEFYGLDFFVDKRVLIPRPETELLIEEVIKRSRIAAVSAPRPIIADIGAGSGCIAVTLAKYLPNAKIYAADISAKALTVAKINAKKHKVSKRIKFLKGDLLSPFQRGSHRALLEPEPSRRLARWPALDIIVANLPYLTHDELANVPHEPRQSLYGGKLGLEIIERLLIQTPKYLKPEGKIFLEISPTQIKALEYIVEQQLPGKKVEFKKDLAGRDRVAMV